MAIGEEEVGGEGEGELRRDAIGGGGRGEEGEKGGDGGRGGGMVHCKVPT